MCVALLPALLLYGGPLATTASANNQCQWSISVSPSSPIPFGTPVTISGNLSAPPAYPSSGSVSLDGRSLGSGQTINVTLNSLTDGQHTINWTCTGGPPGPGSASGSKTFTVSLAPVYPKYLVLAVTYAPPGQQSFVDYGASTIFGNRTTHSSSFQTTESVDSKLTIGTHFKIGNTTSFSQMTSDSQTINIQKTSSNDIVIPGPRNSLDGIDHNEDVIFVWINPAFTMTQASVNSLLWNGFDVDPRDPVSPNMDVVPLTVRQLKDPLHLIDAGDASRLQRSWAGSGQALTIDDFNTILARDPCANGCDSIDPVRFDLLPGAAFDYKPADPGGQPITQRHTVNYTMTSTLGNTATDTYTSSFQTFGGGTFLGFLKLERKNTFTLQWTNTHTTEDSSTTSQSTTFSLTGPTTGYQGPTAVQVYKDNVYGSMMFAFAKVATFELGATNPTQTVTQGGTATYGVTTQSDFGFTDNVSFDPNVVGLPAGAQATFSPASVPAGSGTSLTVTTTAQTPAGTYPLTMTASSGLIVRHLTVSLVVNPLPFTLSVTPPSQTVASGQGTTYTVSVSPAGGFTGPVQLSGPDGLPPGATASYSPTTVNGAGSSTLTVTTAGSTPAGTSTLTIVGTGGSITQRATVSLVVNNIQDFGLTVTPQAAGIAAGDTATYTVTTTAINGFSGDVGLTVSGQPAGTTPAFDVNPIAGAGSSTLSIATTTRTTPGNYQLTIVGTSGNLTHSQTVTLTVSPPTPDFTLAATPSTQSAPPGGSATYSVSTAAVGDFTGSIDLSVSDLPAGVTASFDLTPISAGSGATLSVSVDATAAPGDYPLTITGTSGGLTHSQTLTLTVT